MSSYQSIKEKLDFQYDLPVNQNWSAAPDFLHLIADYCLQYKPDTILECSSGITTLVLARCCQINNRGHVFSLENGAEYASTSLDHLQQFQLGNHATVIHAPLEESSLGDRGFLWYSTRDIPRQPIDMLVIDGPPGFIQKHARYPALPLLYDRLSDGCRIYLDDAARDDEQEIASMWQSSHPGMDYQYLDTERGCAVFTIHR